MAETPIQLVERECAYLRSLEGRAFFLGLARFTAALEDRPEVSRVLQQIEREKDEALARHIGAERNLIEKVKELRRDLVSRAPEIDDSDATPPQPPYWHRSPAWNDYSMTLAYFDEVSALDPPTEYPPLPDDVEQENYDPAGLLLTLLERRLNVARWGET